MAGNFLMARWLTSGRSIPNNWAVPTWRRFSFTQREKPACLHASHDRSTSLPFSAVLEERNAAAHPAAETAEIPGGRSFWRALFFLHLFFPVSYQPRVPSWPAGNFCRGREHRSRELDAVRIDWGVDTFCDC